MVVTTVGLVLLGVAACRSEHADESAHSWDEPPPFVWEPQEEGYYLDPVPGDPEECCGSAIVGDPEDNQPPFDCDCDLTTGDCNVGCCCDPECEPIDRQRVFGCTSNSSAGDNAVVKTCSGELVTVNLPESAASRGWTTSELDGVLCIVTDNSPSRGSFYRDPEEASDMTTREIAEEIEKEGAPLYSQWAQPTPRTSSTFYTINDTTLGDGCLSPESDEGCSSRAPLLLPFRAAGGECSGSRWIQFLADVPPYTCTPADNTTLEELCVTVHNAAARYSERSSFAPSPTASVPMEQLSYFISDGADPSNFSEVEVGQLPEAVYDSGSQTCSNAITTLQYRLFVDGAEGVITDVRVYMELDAIAQAMPLEYGAGFEFVGAGAPASPRDVSGRPGYMRGLPMLIADGDLTALQLRAATMQMLPRSAAGACIQSVEDPDTADRSTALLFGEDAAAHCYEAFTDAAALQEWCQPTPPDELPLLAVLNLSWTSEDNVAAYVGSYGDAHPGAPDDWAELIISLPSSGLTREWHEPSQSCRNVLAMMEFQVLFAEVGAAYAPSKKIIGVQLVLSSQTVRAGRCTPGAGSCAQRTFVSAASSFVELSKDGRAYDFVPPAPGRSVKLPADFFSPFVSTDDNDDSSTGAQGRRSRRQLSQQKDHQPGTSMSAYSLVSIPIAMGLALWLGRNLAATR